MKAGEAEITRRLVEKLRRDTATIGIYLVCIARLVLLIALELWAFTAFMEMVNVL